MATGAVRALLRLEGGSALVLAVAIYFAHGGNPGKRREITLKGVSNPVAVRVLRGKLACPLIGRIASPPDHRDAASARFTTIAPPAGQISGLPGWQGGGTLLCRPA